MLNDLVRPEILQLIEQRDWASLREALAEEPPPEVADLLLHLRKQERVLLFRALRREQAAEVFANAAMPAPEKMFSASASLFRSSPQSWS